MSTLLVTDSLRPLQVTLSPTLAIDKESWPKGPGFGLPLKRAVLLKAIQVKSV